MKTNGLASDSGLARAGLGPMLPAFVALLVAVAPGHARINVVTLPGRDTVQMTIYNSADITLVKETRTLTFRRGLNKLEFSWANTLIDPTSVEFRALTHADAVEVLDISFPPRVANTLEWRIQSEYAGEVTVEIRYFTSGITWSADYVVEAGRDEKTMALAGSVRVTNGSGEDYENAQVRLVVGVIRLVENIAQLAQQGRPGGQPQPMPAAAPPAAETRKAARAAVALLDRMEEAGKPREVAKEELGEYFLYTVEGRDTIPTGWSKRLPSFKAPGVPITSYYKFEKERWNQTVMRYYRFTNSVPSKLGKEPLPDGSVMAFRLVSDDQLYGFVGRTTVKYIPVQETVDLELGNDQEVMVKPVQMNWEKLDVRFDQQGNVKGWTVKETWEIEVQNSKDIDIVLDLRRNFGGDWSLTADAKYEKVDASKVKFVFPLQPRQKLKFTYELTTRHGLNATR
jgi:hypothetical protein